jgi:hypothetical protein
LHRGALGVRMIVSGTMRRVNVVVMMVIVHILMFMTVPVMMMTVVVMTHGGPQ